MALMEHLFIDPHQASGLIGFALIFNAAEAVAPLAMISFMVVVEFYLPYGLKTPNVFKLDDDLQGLPLPTLGVGHSFCVIESCVTDNLWVSGFLLQQNDGST